MIDFSGQRVLVTGGSRGIGRAITLAFARAGADVAINYLRDHAAAEATADEVRELGRECRIFQCNVAEDDHVGRMFDELKEGWDGLDHLISNAASGVLRPALKLKARHWDWTMNINARAVLSLVRRAEPMMREGSAIVGLSSLGSMMAIPDYTAVGASKAALEATLRHLAIELAPRIRVNCVSGGLVDTDALKHFPKRDEMLASDLERAPMKRHVAPDDLANAVLFLCSDLSNMVIGHTLVVDGGYHIV